MKRISVNATILSLVLSFGAPVSSAEEPADWCSSGAPAPCIESVTVNGAAVTDAHPTWGLDLFTSTVEGTRSVSWIARRHGVPDAYAMGTDSLDDVWVIRIDTGSVIPRVASAYGSNASFTRTDDGDGTYHASVTATPIVHSQSCDVSAWPWTCPATPASERVGYLGGRFHDYGTWENVGQRKAMYGLDQSTNVDAWSSPPEIDTDPATGAERILLRLANAHFRADGTTVFLGFARVRIPSTFLKKAYGIDDPATLTGAGVVPTISGGGGGTVTATMEPGGGALLVEATNLTFSARIIRIKRGTITPTRPRDLRARRTGSTTGKLRFDPATPRGSRIVGYVARCVSGSSVVRKRGTRSPIALGGLTPGMSYSCRVRARSKAGPGRWSGPDRLPASA